MIDERINNTLNELEKGLINIESARKQVENTVNSFNALTGTTTEFVNQLGTITTKIHELVECIGQDYEQKVKIFEKDRDAIINASTDAIGKISNAIEDYKESLSIIQTNLKYSMVINAISLFAIVALVFHFFY